MPCDYTPIPDANLQVIGPPGGVTSGNVAVFDGTSGNVIADGGPPSSGGITQLTGDVTAGPGSGSQAATIANDAVTNAKLANMTAATIKGRASGAGTGDPTDLSGTQVTVILDVMVGDSGAGGTKGLVPAAPSGSAAAGKFLKADGTFDVPAGTGTGTVTHTAGALTLNELVLGAGSADIKVVAATDGQVPIGKSSDGTVTLATITAGTGITITNGASSITIAASGGSSVDYVVMSDGNTPVPSPMNDGLGNFIYVTYSP